MVRSKKGVGGLCGFYWRFRGGRLVCRAREPWAGMLRVAGPIMWPERIITYSTLRHVVALYIYVLITLQIIYYYEIMYEDK